MKKMKTSFYDSKENVKAVWSRKARFITAFFRFGLKSLLTRSGRGGIIDEKTNLNLWR